MAVPVGGGAGRTVQRATQSGTSRAAPAHPAGGPTTPCGLLLRSAAPHGVAIVQRSARPALCTSPATYCPLRLNPKARASLVPFGGASLSTFVPRQRNGSMRRAPSVSKKPAIPPASLTPSPCDPVVARTVVATIAPVAASTVHRTALETRAPELVLPAT